MTSDADHALLLEIAREAIAAHVNPHSAVHSAIRDLQSATPQRRAGAFVTIHHRGDLRGCIGHIEASEPLGRVVARCAIAACSADPRFKPITPAELDEIGVEISVLGPLESIAGPQDIEVGRHGLVVEDGWHRGLLLPQVATERQWDAGTFLSETCRKAGLSRDAWRHGATLWRFEADVFS
jgi:AmmeMemoRadiSam system protein A